MKANEITIGDWVHCITDNTNHKIAEISILDRAEVLGHEYYRTEEGAYNFITDIEGIPLTKEILEKNEFLYDGVSFWYLDFRIVLSTSKGVSLVCGRQKRFEYVHELQHALRLADIDKEIIL